MKPLLESSIERAACEAIKRQLGVVSIKLKVGSGWPDRMFLVPGGRPCFVEFKAPGEAPRPLQKAVHDDLRLLGYDAHACDSVASAVAAVARALASAQRAAKVGQVSP